MSAPILPRRTFLRGLASLPLIGGGVTLIGRPAAPVPLADVAAAPLFSDPHESARYAWEAFSAAMREVTAEAHGWYVQGGERRMAIGYMPVQAPWCRSFAVHLEPAFPDRQGSRGLVERHEEVGL